MNQIAPEPDGRPTRSLSGVQNMFFVTYLRRELRRRMRQAVFISLGLALGVGLVVTVTAASAGVKKAQANVLSSLYGVGTDVTVTGRPPKAPALGKTPPKGGQTFQIGPGGARVCQNGKCHSAAGQKIDHLTGTGYGPISQSKVAQVARLNHVKAAAGGLVLADNQITIPKNVGQPGSPLPTPSSFNVDGVDTGHLSLGPLSAGTLTSGRSLAGSDATSNVAVVDSGYARSHKLKTGSVIHIVGHKFTVIGIVAQPQGGSPPDVYIPLARAQALAKGPDGKSLQGDVNAIYVTAASAADITAVQDEIKRVLPHTTVTTAASLASQVTGSLASTAKLANVLGRWLSVLVLIAAFAVASLLTIAAVARRVREFGTLKALGWRSRRIIAQVMGESVAMGVIGGAAGAGLGFAGSAIITAIAPKLTASVASSTGQRVVSVGGPSTSGGGPQGFTPTVTHTVAVPMSASVTAGAIALAVVLAVVGGLLAGSFGSWRIARLRPADALTRVG
jgi:putative ABC transport system permease protein